MLFPKLLSLKPYWNHFWERQRQSGEKGKGVRGWERQRKKKAAFQLKISPQFKDQLWAGWWSWGRRKEQRQGRTGALCISFRSHRVWSSILYAQRYSSLVHFSFSSKSSIVFSSLATHLSANAARVSASLSLSVWLFISSSYLPSFQENFSSAALRLFRWIRFWSISLICSSISRQRLLVIVTGITQARLWEGRKINKEHSKDTSSKTKEKKNQKNGKKTSPWLWYVMSRREECKGSTNKHASALTLLYKASRRAGHGCLCPKCPSRLAKW